MTAILRLMRVSHFLFFIIPPPPAKDHNNYLYPSGTTFVNSRPPLFPARRKPPTTQITNNPYFPAKILADTVKNY